MFDDLIGEAKEREYWAEDDARWGTYHTTLVGFWLAAFFGRFWRAFIQRSPIDSRFGNWPFRRKPIRWALGADYREIERRTLAYMQEREEFLR